MTPKKETFDRAIKIAKSIGKLISENGGTSGHVSAAAVRLPASTFDQLLSESSAIGYAAGELRFYGVLFERGPDDAAIRAKG